MPGRDQPLSQVWILPASAALQESCFLGTSISGTVDGNPTANAGDTNSIPDLGRSHMWQSN